MALELTLDKVHAMVEKVIEEKGAEYIYPNWGPSCKYVDSAISLDGEREVERGCIVGHIFIDELKLDMIELSRTSVNEESARQFLSYLVRNGEVTIADVDRSEIFSYLCALQQSQDNGRAWGEAHRMAKSGMAWNKHARNWEEYCD